jgi:ATP-dependent Clp protease ATP-binding subunit ClpA
MTWFRPSVFTPRALKVLTLAREEAARFHHQFVGTEHLLLGLLQLQDGVAVKVLEQMGVNLQAIRSEVEKNVPPGPDEKMKGLIPYTPRVKKCLALAAKEAKTLKNTYVGTEHILLGLLREGDGVAARVLKILRVDIDLTRQQVLKTLDPNFSAEGEASDFSEELESQDSLGDAIDVSKRYDVYCREGDHEVIYRNALFKGIKTLFPKNQAVLSSEYLELEQADGATLFIARFSLLKFAVHVPPANP